MRSGTIKKKSALASVLIAIGALFSITAIGNVIGGVAFAWMVWEKQ